MKKSEFESTTFGAEALPSGLADIERSLGVDSTRSALPGVARAQQPTAAGLLARARRWLHKRSRR